jgi:hypothetical protein
VQNIDTSDLHYYTLRVQIQIIVWTLILNFGQGFVFWGEIHSMDLQNVFYTGSIYCIYGLISGSVATVLHNPLCRYALLGFTISISIICMVFKFLINRSYTRNKQLSSEMVHHIAQYYILDLCCFNIAISFSLQRNINLSFVEIWILCPMCTILMKLFLDFVQRSSQKTINIVYLLSSSTFVLDIFSRHYWVLNYQMTILNLAAGPILVPILMKCHVTTLIWQGYKEITHYEWCFGELIRTGLQRRVWWL